jgi:DNA-binding GntR family transcriptional regulator
VYEDNLWNVRGRYEAAVEENEAVDWSVLNHQFNLKLLIVSFLIVFIEILRNNFVSRRLIRCLIY